MKRDTARPILISLVALLSMPAFAALFVLPVKYPSFKPVYLAAVGVGGAAIILMNLRRARCWEKAILGTGILLLAAALTLLLPDRQSTVARVLLIFGIICLPIATVIDCLKRNPQTPSKSP